MLGRFLLMAQAAFLDRQFFDLLPPFNDGRVTPEVDIGGRNVAKALVVARVVVMIDEAADLHFERWHQTLKNRILLGNYYLPGDLEMQIGAFVDHYNNHRYHESLANVTPADVYFGRDTAIIERRKMIKKLTIQKRRLNHQRQAA